MAWRFQIFYIAERTSRTHTTLSEQLKKFCNMTDFTKSLMNDGGYIPTVAFGTGTTYFNRGDDVSEGILKAVNVGYRLIDTAVMYGTEVGVGNALAKIKREGVHKREDLFITTKLPARFHKLQAVIDIVDKSMENLQVDYIDLVMIHFPGLPPHFKTEKEPEMFIPKDPKEIEEARMEMWEGLQKCQELGKVKHIGVSNFTRHHIEQLVQNPRCRVIPAVNQVEFNPYMVDADILAVCKEHGILVQSYGPVGSGAKTANVAGDKEKEDVSGHVLEDPVLRGIAMELGCTVAQVCIGYALAKGVIVVTKTEKEERMKENLKSTDVASKLTIEHVQQIDLINRNQRKFWNPYLVE